MNQPPVICTQRNEGSLRVDQQLADHDNAMTEFHILSEAVGNRKLAYSRLGELSAKHIFVCLPGLLETRESFDALLQTTKPYEECCWLSLDYCGRGGSDPLPATSAYSFTQYLADTKALIESLVFSQKTDQKTKKLHLIGTSMGGILALYLANRLEHKVDSLIINDIGLNLHWSALVSLYQRIDESKVQLKQLKLDPRAVEAVRGRAHFDLPCEFDLLGMKFQSLLKNHKARVVLVHNAHSPICSLEIAEQSQKQCPHIRVWTLERHGHPALWDESITIKLMHLLRIKPKSPEDIESATTPAQTDTLIDREVLSPEMVDIFIKTSQIYLAPSAVKTSRWFIVLADRLMFWKRSFS